MRCRRPIALLASVAFLTGIAGSEAPAHAQEDGAEEDQLQPLRDCRAIAQPDARLACFDAAVARVIARQDSGELRVVDKEDIDETRRGLFGFSMPKLGIFSSGDDEADKKLQSQIVSLRRVGREAWQVEITEGSVWQVSDAPSRFKPEIDDPVELEKAAMGSYWLRLDGALGVKARRIR